MPKIVHFIALMVAGTCSPALASGQLLWKIPFRIEVTAQGKLTTHSWFVPTHGKGTDSYSSNDTTFSFSFSVDSSKEVTYFTTGDTVNETGTYSFVKDTLRYEHRRIATGPYPSRDSSLVIIVFDTSKDSVISLWLALGHWSSYAFLDQGSAFRLRAINFNVDDSSMYTFDSSMSAHAISVDYSQYTAEYYWGRQNSSLGQFSSTDLRVSSIDLAGIVRAVHLADPARVLSQRATRSSFAASSFGHDLYVSLARAEDLEAIELYSLLGTKLDVKPSTLSQTEALIRGVPPGLYIVRVRDQVEKVLLTQ